MANTGICYGESSSEKRNLLCAVKHPQIKDKGGLMLIGYARVSTIDQNLDLQLDALNRAGCKRIFQDEGISGAKANRPGLDETLKTLKRGDHLIVWKLDRLGRSLRHLIDLITGFEEKGIGFTSISDGIDTTTPIGKLFFHLSGAFAEYETNINSERTKAGMAAAKARGVKMGRPRKRTPDQQQEIAKFDSARLDAAAKNIGVDKQPFRDNDETVQ
jgi:Enterobacteriaceae phage serine recombinase